MENDRAVEKDRALIDALERLAREGCHVEIDAQHFKRADGTVRVLVRNERGLYATTNATLRGALAHATARVLMKDTPDRKAQQQRG